MKINAVQIYLNNQQMIFRKQKTILRPIKYALLNIEANHVFFPSITGTQTCDVHLAWYSVFWCKMLLCRSIITYLHHLPTAVKTGMFGRNVKIVILICTCCFCTLVPVSVFFFPPVFLKSPWENDYSVY